MKKILLQSQIMKIGQYNKGVSLRYRKEMSPEDNELMVNAFQDFIEVCNDTNVNVSLFIKLRNAAYRSAANLLRILQSYRRRRVD